MPGVWGREAEVVRARGNEAFPGSSFPSVVRCYAEVGNRRRKGPVFRERTAGT